MKYSEKRSSLTEVNADCSNLHLECPSQTMCYRLVSSLWHCWEVVEPSGSSVKCKEVRGLWEHAPEGDLGPWLLLSLFLATIRWAVLLHVLLCCNVLLCYGSKSNGTNWLWIETMSKKPTTDSCLSMHFVMTTESWQTHYQNPELSSVWYNYILMCT